MGRAPPSAGAVAIPYNYSAIVVHLRGSTKGSGVVEWLVQGRIAFTISGRGQGSMFWVSDREPVSVVLAWAVRTYGAGVDGLRLAYRGVPLREDETLATLAGVHGWGREVELDLIPTPTRST
jgi:hypothetical protein